MAAPADELAVVLGATCAGLLLVHDLLGDQADFVRWDRLRSQAGILALAAAAALPALALYRRLHRWRLLPLVVAGVLATAQYGALNYLRNQPFAEYMAHKTHYLFPYLLAGLAAGVVGAAASKLRRVPALSVGAGGTALALLLGATGLYRQPSGWSGFSPYHPLTPDQVAAGIWMRDHLRPDPENVSFVVDDSITAYWLKTGILRGERGWSASSVQRYAPPHYAHWITDPATPTYALVAGAERADGPPMRVLFEHVTARVVERVPEARSAQRAVHVQVYSAIEQYAGRPTLRSAAYLSNLPDPAFELRFLLTEQHAGDEPPSVLWDQPLSTHRHAAGRYGLVRLDPAASTAWTWLDGAPRDVPPPVWTPGMALSGWMQLRYHDQPVATRRIYDFVAGDADSFVPRDLNPNSIFHWEPGMPAAAPPGRVAGVTLGDRVTLERWDISDDMAAPGAVVVLSAQWQAAGPVEPPARLFVHLIDADGRSYPVWDGEPQSGFYPFWLWRPGEQIRDVYQLQIPGDLHAGEYEIVAGIYNPLTGARLPVTGGPASTVAQAGRMGTLVVK